MINLFSKIKYYLLKISMPELLKAIRRINSYDIDFIYQGKRVLWLDPWRAINSLDRNSLQLELNKELSEFHPLYKFNPQIIARSYIPVAILRMMFLLRLMKESLQKCI